MPSRSTLPTNAHFSGRWLSALVTGMFGVFMITGPAVAQIVPLDDAPAPLSAEESAQRFSLSNGFRLQLVACEPMVREPSGVAWDERGQMFVCELHGYNLEGHYDVQELNQTGQLDRVVRRIQANPRARQRAEEETYSTIKLLRDLDGDGVADEAVLWAEHLPPCLGICPTQGGLVAACQTQILFLADRNGDGTADVREVWFEGFEKGPLERSINCPQWGPDGWIYFGCGAGGGTIRGKYLKEAVQLPRTDFRIRPDGTALQPVVGSTGTMGFTFTEAGDRFVIATNSPGYFVAPLPWQYLARNPFHSAGRLQENASSDQRVYPISPPHPWRTRRADDAEFAKFYTDRYGIAESAPNGYFTSACSPFYYQDTALPGLHGQLLACEPAQNLVHRAVVTREGARLRLSRPQVDEQREFLASSDPWFHPITLSHAPDGSIVVCDFYREIIEDYSAIPRYLQQQYSLINGHQHGRIWRLTHDSLPPGRWFGQVADLSGLSDRQLVDELTSARWWRCETARRLLVSRPASQLAPLLTERLHGCEKVDQLLNLLRTLQGLDALTASHVRLALEHSDARVRRLGLETAEPWQDTEPAVAALVRACANDPEASVRLQAALSLGGQPGEAATACLAQLARDHAEEPWMIDAIMSSSSERALPLLIRLLSEPQRIASADRLLEPLCMTIGRRRRSEELSAAIVLAAQLSDDRLQRYCLRGLLAAFATAADVELSEAAIAALKALSRHPSEAVSAETLRLIKQWRIESPVERQARLEWATAAVADNQLTVAERLAAVTQLTLESESPVAAALVAALPSATPQVREAIMRGLFAQQERWPTLIEALADGRVSPSMINAVGRSQLLESADPVIRQRAAELFQRSSGVDELTLAEYLRALQGPRDASRGEQLYRQHCAKCHQAHGMGHAVGPDLSAEFQRAEETIVQDVLAPSDLIASGYLTYLVETQSGQIITGILAAESPTSVSLRQAEGVEQVVLRSEIEQLRAMPVSLMPDDLYRSLPPSDLADLISWIRRPPGRLLLLDEDRRFADALSEGEGTAQFTDAEAYSGRLSLAVTPPQRYSASIAGWSFPIRQHPQPGEYRYLRFAWKAAAGQSIRGAMLELAANGAWPASDQAQRRFHAGTNTTAWQSTELSAAAPSEWTQVTVDLWQDAGDFNLTGIAPTAMGGTVLFDRLELLQTVPNESAVR